MKIILFCVVIVLSNAAIAADEWSREDKHRQAVYTALHLTDWAQTRVIASDPTRAETNSFMVGQPSSRQVNQYFASTLILHYITAHYLPKEWRQTFQYVTIGIQGAAVTHNYSVGIRVQF